MKFSAIAVASSLTALVAAQRPSNTSICDYYTTALLKNNTGANQLMLLTLLVNTAVIGNYSQPAGNVTVPGILAKGTYNGTAVNLLPYFDGTLLSSNGGGMNGTSVNFLDDGGAAPLMMNKPSNGNTGSRQYLLLTHLYSYFGGLLGCTMVGQTGFPAYSGQTSQYNVHKFMNLNPYQVGYFIQQVGLSAASFGVATSDIQAAGMALSKAFNVRCGPKISIPASAPADLQSICLTGNCPLADNSTCSAYQPSYSPAFANGTVIAAPGANTTTGLAGNGTSGSGSGSGGSSSSTSKSNAMATFAPGAGVLAMVVGAAAML